MIEYKPRCDVKKTCPSRACFANLVLAALYSNKEQQAMRESRPSFRDHRHKKEDPDARMEGLLILIYGKVVLLNLPCTWVKNIIENLEAVALLGHLS